MGKNERVMLSSIGKKSGERHSYMASCCWKGTEHPFLEGRLAIPTDI